MSQFLYFCCRYNLYAFGPHKQALCSEGLSEVVWVSWCFISVSSYRKMIDRVLLLIILLPCVCGWSEPSLHHPSFTEPHSLI